MGKMNLDRREFLQFAAAGATVLAVGNAFGAPSAVQAAAQPAARIFVCTVCGHVEFGAAPAVCPVCHSAREQFKQNDTLFSDNESKYKGLSISHSPVVSARKDAPLIHEQPSHAVSFRIGRLLHPMEAAHHIDFADCYIDDQYRSRILFSSGSQPAGVLYVGTGGLMVRIVSMCNQHGYWQTEAGMV